MNYKEELERIYNREVPRYNNLDKKIVIYGAGSLGQMGTMLLLKAGIKPEYIIDKSKKGNIAGIKIISPEEIPEKDKNEKLFLVCISTISYNEISNFLKNINIKNIIQFYTYAYIKFPELLSNGWTCYKPTEVDKQNIERVCEILSHDDLSLHHYLQFLWWKLRGIERLYLDHPVLTGKKFFNSPCFKNFSKEEVLLDCGCHYGQTIKAFQFTTGNTYKEIIAIEPDLYNLKICKDNLNNEKINYKNIALSDKIGKKSFINGLGYASKLDNDGNVLVETETVDSLNVEPTIIKIHCEGEELKILQGAKKTIKNYHPKLMVLADHNEDGLYKIPLFINDFGYKIYFNLHDYCGNSAVFYGK